MKKAQVKEAHVKRHLFVSILALGMLGAVDAQAADCDLAAGAKTFQALQCASCHTFVAEDYDKSGPNLHGVIGRRAGTASFTAYSQALKQSGIIWNAQTLDQWLTNPGAFVPGTVMPFAGTADADTRNLLICYLTEKSK